MSTAGLEYPFADTPAPGELREIVPGVLWLRMPLPMALDHINLYLLEDTDGWWIVDTGIAVGPTRDMWKRVFATHLAGKPVKAVISTHCHPDHIGLAGWLCERWRVPFYMTQAEYFSSLVFSRLQAEHFSWTSEQFMQRAGYTREQVERVRKSFGGYSKFVEPLPTAYLRLVDGGSLVIKDRRWRVVVGKGHSPEHACLYCEALNILLSGDQVIPRITSNISVMALEPEANPLKQWFRSHERFLDLLPADALVLPAHNTPFRGLHERLRYLIEHHEDHLLALEQACLDATPTPMELLPVMFKRKLDDNHLGLALGECIGHLNFLHQRGQLARETDAQGRHRYRSIDATLSQRLRARRYEADDSPPLQV